VEAIYHENNVPSPWAHFVELNAVRSRELRETGNITERQEPKPGPECAKKH
jgi:hypothetical protein